MYLHTRPIRKKPIHERVLTNRCSVSVSSALVSSLSDSHIRVSAESRAMSLTQRLYIYIDSIYRVHLSARDSHIRVTA